MRPEGVAAAIGFDWQDSEVTGRLAREDQVPAGLGARLGAPKAQAA